MDLRLDVTERSGWSVLRVGGEIDVATAPRLREQLITLVNEQRYHLVVDLTDVDFLDSTGLGVLIGALKRVRTHEGDLRIVATANRVVKVFDITGLDQVFSIHPDLDSALPATES
jgi:anti-sigma B factor antagonist